MENVWSIEKEKKEAIISIIVPVYNVEKYLRRCIKSLINSRFKEIEIILVDDKSTDTSGKICDEFSIIDSRVKVLHKKIREGTAAARTSGIRISKGKYIGFVDADDWIEKEMYYVLYKMILASGADIACCEFFDNYYDREEKHINSGDTCVYTKIEALRQIHLRRDVFGTLCNKLFDRNILREYSFITEVIIGEDYTILVNMIEKCNKIISTKRSLYHYFHRREGVCNSGYTKKHISVLKNYNHVCSGLIDKYPQIKKEIICYYCVEAMAVVTAMVKNQTYDRRVINYVMKLMRKYLLLFLSTKKILIQFKGAGVMMAIDYRLFIFTYKMINKDIVGKV